MNIRIKQAFLAHSTTFLHFGTFMNIRIIMISKIIMIRKIIMINCIFMHILYVCKGHLHSVTNLPADIILYRVSIDTNNSSSYARIPLELKRKVCG